MAVIADEKKQVRNKPLDEQLLSSKKLLPISLLKMIHYGKDRKAHLCRYGAMQCNKHDHLLRKLFFF